jgi:hypothetical protein
MMKLKKLSQVIFSLKYSGVDFFKEDVQLPLARIKKIMKLDEEVKVNNILSLDDIRRNTSHFFKSL